jgi:hypothetical protein
MRRIFVSVLVSTVISCCNPVFSQFYYYNDKYYNTDWVFELGVSGGMMNSLTDIGGKKGVGKKFIKDLNWRVSKPSFGTYAVATWHDVIGIKLEACFGNIGSYDSILKKVGPSTFGRYERNLSFRSSITDIMLAIEIHPLFFKTFDEDHPAPLWSPYIIGGIGYYSFNPQALLNNQWYSLQPLHTEGQGFKEYPDRVPYQLSQINIPAGLGVKYEVSSSIIARLEFIYRFLFTDYLDDVSQVDYIDPSLFNTHLPPQQAALARQLYDRRISVVKNNQRGDPKDNDAFFTIQLKVGFTIRAARGKQ